MSKKHTTTNIPEEYDEYPEITAADLENAKYRIGMKEVSKEEWLSTLPRKQRINIMLDTAIIARFKEMAGERGYQTLINETLRQSLSQQDIESTLRKVIREELKLAA
jgi:uncharacterized protein (DUF4415 family)